jgi:hypothetical protein
MAAADSRSRSAALADSLAAELAEVGGALRARQEARGAREAAAAKLAALAEQLADYRATLLAAPRAIAKEARDARFTLTEGGRRRWGQGWGRLQELAAGAGCGGGLGFEG